MSITIGLTGPTGSGKSSASKLLADFGFKVIDCDKTARKATEKGAEGLTALVLAFGDDILLSDGALNRKRLAEKAFSTKENTELLNKTILPFIVKIIEKETDNGDILLDAPTLFESGINRICDFTVAVLADREIRLKRIIKRDNLTIKEANTRINAGKTDEFYKQNADIILYNNGEQEEFLQEFSNRIKQKIGR